jgi:predicted deacylase
MDGIEAANPSFVSQYSAGLSTLNRDLRVIKINTGNNPAKRVWIDCGIHAREWISPATCVNLIDKVRLLKIIFIVFLLTHKIYIVC